MNAARVADTGLIRPKVQVPKNAAHNRAAEAPKPKVKQKAPDVKQTKSILDEFTKNTRFSYTINKKIDSFVVKIIDRDTDKVVKEIPSKELQKLHENLREAIGIFIDEMV